MTELKNNVIANFLGKGWAGLISLIFIPVYIKFIGIEAYGLVGIFISLQALASLLDLGLSATINRELARMSADIAKAAEVRDLVRTLEIVYWSIAVVVGIVVMLLAKMIAYYWVTSEVLSEQTIYYAVMLMGLIIAFQWPFSLYSGGLLGLQKQVLLNSITALIATLRSVGAVFVLWLIEPSIIAFFCWQIIVSIIQTIIAAAYLRQQLPGPKTKAQFRTELLSDIWRFAAGMTGISVLSVILMQMDKIMLSRLLSLESFGYYTLASVAAGGLYILFGPIYAALFPRFSQLVARGDILELKRLYHNGCQLMSVVVLPVTIVVALFSKEILLIWTGDKIIAEHTHLILSFLVIGTAMGGLMNLPFAAQLAYGWTSLPFYQNLVAIIALIPMLLWLTNVYGAEGAAFVWVILNAGYVLIGIQFMHRKIFKGEKLRWYLNDTAGSLLTGLIITVPAYFWFPFDVSMSVTFIGLVIITAISVLGSALRAPFTRHAIMQTIKVGLYRN